MAQFITRAETITKLKSLGVIRADSGLKRLIREQGFPSFGNRATFFVEESIDQWLSSWTRDLAKSVSAQIRTTNKQRKTRNAKKGDAEKSATDRGKSKIIAMEKTA